jgi:hypothetical protein
VAGDPQYYGEITPDPAHFDRLCGVAVTPACTSDGGKTFQPVTWGVHSDHHYIAFDPSDTLHMWDGNDGGLYETTDGGRTWRHFENLPVLQFYRIAADNALPFYNVYGGTQDNGSPGTPTRSPSASGIRSAVLERPSGDGFYARRPVDPAIIYRRHRTPPSCVSTSARASTNIAPPRVVASVAFGRGSRSRYRSSSARNASAYVFTNVLFKSEDRGDHWTPIGKDLTRALDRDTFTVMGRKWGPTAVNKHLFTNDLSLGTALDESPLTPGLLYAGTDDGLIQVTENGGTTWRKIDKVAGVPEYTPISALVASRHNNNVVYATFNNQLHGDFTPYVFKSTDRGRTWTSIRANLPNRNEVWTIVEDHVDPNLLFVGTGRGVRHAQQWRRWAAPKRDCPPWRARHTGATQRKRFAPWHLRPRDLMMDDYSPLHRFRATHTGCGAPSLGGMALRVDALRARRHGSGLYAGENAFRALLSLHAAQPARPARTSCSR